MNSLYYHEYTYFQSKFVIIVADICDLFQYVPKFEFDLALELICQISPAELKSNYDPKSADNPSNIYLKINEVKQKKGIFAILKIDNELKAFGISYERDFETCFLASRAFVLPGRFQGQGILSSYIIPSLQQVQKNRYKYGIITFNINSYSNRLWKAYRRMILNPWVLQKHLQVLRNIYGNKYQYFKLVPRDSAEVVNHIQQNVVICNFEENIFENI